MKVRYKDYIQQLQENLGFKPTHAMISKCLLKAGKNVSANALSNRLSNNGFVDDEEQSIVNMSLGAKAFENDTVVKLDYYKDIEASAGFGCEAYSGEVLKMNVSKDSIRNYSSHKKYSVVNVLGRSMEPTLISGDKLVIEHTDDNKVIDDDLYVFAYEGHIYVKRLIKNINELVVKSDNADKETYRTQFISKDEMNNVRIIGHCVALIREKV